MIDNSQNMGIQKINTKNMEKYIFLNNQWI